MLYAHRVTPHLMGIITQNTGGFGDIGMASCIFVRNELTQLQGQMKELYNWVCEEMVRFEEYKLGDLKED